MLSNPKLKPTLIEKKNSFTNNLEIISLTSVSKRDAKIPKFVRNLIMNANISHQII